MSDRHRSIVDLYVLLERGDGQVLLLERANTGYADGWYCPPSGHLEEGESVVAGAIREVREEVGVEVRDLEFLHTVHHRTAAEEGRIGLFFRASEWDGEPVNAEPHKCAGIRWVDPADPPPNTVPYTANALARIREGHRFSLDGW